MITERSISTEIRGFNRHTFVKSFAEVDSQRRDIFGGKGANLARLAQAGFPVPWGYVVTTSAYDHFVRSGGLPSGLVESMSILKEQLGGKVALRSSGTCEDGSNISLAGVFSTEYLYEDANLEEALVRIYTQSQSADVIGYLRRQGISPEGVRMAVILQKLIVPDVSGVIYTGVNGTSILVEYKDGFGADLVDGKTAPRCVLLDKSGRILETQRHKSSVMSSMTLSVIASRANQIEHLFNDGRQDIEFALKSGELYILQARSLIKGVEGLELRETVADAIEETKERFRGAAQDEKRALGTDKVIFSRSNYSELLPQPTEMDFGIFAYIFTGSDGIPGAIQLGRQEMGYLIQNKGVEYTHFIGGKPYFTLAMDALTFYAGFPDSEREYIDTLVSEYHSATQKNPRRGSYPEMGLYLQTPTLEDLKERYGDKAEEYFQTYRDFVENIDKFAVFFERHFLSHEVPNLDKFIEEMSAVRLTDLSAQDLVKHINTILEHLRTVTCINFVKGTRVGFFNSHRLKLEIAKLPLRKTQRERLFGRLNKGLGGKFTEVNRMLAEAATDEGAYALGRSLVGHFSSKEQLEIRHPRFRDDEEALKRYVDGVRRSGKYVQSTEMTKQERLEEIGKFLAKFPDERREEVVKIIKDTNTYMALRETIKYHFTREYPLIRDALVELGHKLGLEEGDIFYVYPRELSQLATSPLEMQHVIATRKQAFENRKMLDLPEVIREEDIENIDVISGEGEDSVIIRGAYLANGRSFEGVVVNVDELSTPENIDREIKRIKALGREIVIVASQMNLSHDPYIDVASGIVLETSGAVAHGAQRARELGRGAIGGINARHLKNGIAVYFDPDSLTIRKI